MYVMLEYKKQNIQISPSGRLIHVQAFRVPFQHLYSTKLSGWSIPNFRQVICYVIIIIYYFDG